MESETNPRDAQEQLAALARAQRAATIEANPPNAWWVPGAAALVGPIAVCVEVLSGAVRIGVVLPMAGALVWIAATEGRAARVRGRRLTSSGGFAARFGFLFVLIGSLQAIEPLSDRVNPWLLVGVSYLAYLWFFRMWVISTDRLVKQCVGPEIVGG